jgi:hypothetical protein
MIRIHTCKFTHASSHIRIRVCSINQYKFVCNRSIIRFRTYHLVSPHVPSHPLRFLAHLLNLYVDTWFCLHVCPSLAYYGKSYFAQHHWALFKALPLKDHSKEMLPCPSRDKDRMDHLSWTAPLGDPYVAFPPGKKTA